MLFGTSDGGIMLLIQRTWFKSSMLENFWVIIIGLVDEAVLISDMTDFEKEFPPYEPMTYLNMSEV